jgi:hypothetical protein
MKGQGNKKRSNVKKSNTYKQSSTNNYQGKNYNHDMNYINRASNNIKHSQNEMLNSRTQKKNSMKYQNNIPNKDIYEYITRDNQPHFKMGEGFNDIPFVNSNINPYSQNYMNIPQQRININNNNLNYKKSSSFNPYDNYDSLNDFTNINPNINEERRKKKKKDNYIDYFNDNNISKNQNLKINNKYSNINSNNINNNFNIENNFNNNRLNAIENNIINQPQRQHNYQRSTSHQIMNNTNDNFFGDFFRDCGVDFDPFSNQKSSFNNNYNNNNIQIRNSNQRNPFEFSIDPFFDDFNFFYNSNPFTRRHFNDNFSSNFRSHNLFEQIIEMLQRNMELAEKKKHPKTSKDALKKLKKFSMSKKFCKKNDKGQLEFPNCCICLSEINSGEETVLLPCGHLFHWNCCFTWLNKNNTCPICRFELPPEIE